MKGQPFISVVMCTYNGELFIDEQITSIINQELIDLELIIMDDCSNDGTWQKLLEWQALNIAIKVFKNDANLGYNKNFEKVIQLATASFIAISDQDDVWLPKKLIKLFTAFVKDDIMLVHSRSVRFEDGRLNYKLAKLHHHFSGNDTRQLLFLNHIMGHDVMFRKQLVSHIVPIPEGMSYDWWIAVVATCYGKVGPVDQFLVHHRIHGNNSFFSNTASKKRELDLDETLLLFATINALKPTDRIYLEKLIKLLADKQQNKPNRFYFPLFKFLFKYRKIIFGHKKRLIPEISYLKNSIKYAKMNYKGKGLSF